MGSGSVPWKGRMSRIRPQGDLASLGRRAVGVQWGAVEFDPARPALAGRAGVPGRFALPGWKPLVDILNLLLIQDEGAWPKPSRPFLPHQPRVALMIRWITGGVAFLILCLSRLIGVHLAVTHDGTRCF